MTPKPLFASKTFWFGIIQIAIGAVGFFSGALDPQLSLGLLVTGLGTIGFRVPTSQPIGGIFHA